MRAINFVKSLLSVIWEAIAKFYENNLLNYSGSIAFFTIFSLPGVLIVVVLIASIFFEEEVVRQEILKQLKSVVGSESAVEIQKILQNISRIEHTLLATLVGIGTILFGATSVFVSIQDGLNIAWRLRPKPRRFALKFILNRLLSFTMVLSIGFVMLVSLSIDALILIFQNFLTTVISNDFIDVIEALNQFASGLIILITFFFIYRFLPDGKVPFKFLLFGAFVSTIQFIIGKYLIGLYLGSSSLGTAYGAAGSLVVLLIWVYYSSVVLLYGAQLMEVMIKRSAHSIIPNSGTVQIVTKEVS